MSFKVGHTKFVQTRDNIALYNISDLTNACDCLDNLQIAIYLLENEKIIYCNTALEKTLGKHCDSFINQGWDYWHSLVSPKEEISVKSRIHDFFSRPYFQEPYMLKYHIMNENGKEIFLRHEILFHSIENQTLAISYFFDITEKESIEKYFQIAKDGDTKFSQNRVTVISPREKEVLKLVADGFSSKQIAARLFISSHTAISHRKNLIEKFKVKNTAQLIKRASWNLEMW